MIDFWDRKNIFITGANGFVGSWITKTLNDAGANTVILIRDMIPKSPILESCRNRSTIIYGNITDYLTVERIFNEYEIDTCFHLAAQTIVDVANRSPLSSFKSNIEGTWNILEAARNSEILKRIVVASSDKAYGEQKELPYREDYCLLGLHPYDASKVCTDVLARTYHNTYGLPVVVTRCANIYGGGDLNFSRIIPGTIRSALHNERPLIRSDGTPIRDYLYIKDAVNAYLTLAEKLNGSVAGQAFNFGTETPVSVLEIVNKIIELSGKTNLTPIITGKGKPKGEIDKQYLSIEKAKKILGWEPDYNLNAGLREAIAWYKSFYFDTD